MMAGNVHLTLRESLGSGAVVLVGLLLLASACTVAPGDSGAAGSIAVVEAMGGGGAEGFARATELRDFSFPDDHGPHEDFRTEWWYFTGNLETDDGEAFGVQVTIFRHALEPRLPQRSSLWASRDVWFAHLAVGDFRRGWFRANERFERGAMGLAGARPDPFAAWVGDWRVESVEESETFPMRLVASADEIGVDLIVSPEKPIVFQGDRGLSQKGPETGNASYYYSVTRLSASGNIKVDGEVVSVSGSAWFDREWSTSALSDGQEGWDWFSIQLEDGRDLMLYRMRRADGTTDPHNSGLMIAADGTTQRLGPDAVRYEPGRVWTSPRSGASYPVEWRLRIEPFDIELDVMPMLDASELDLAVRYWEGAIRVSGTEGNEPIGGRGFLEMSGYANPQPMGESAPAR
jgi:predicted secreted hydrolase